MKTAKRRTRRHRTRKHKKIRRLRHKTTRRVGGVGTPLGFAPTYGFAPPYVSQDEDPARRSSSLGKLNLNMFEPNLGESDVDESLRGFDPATPTADALKAALGRQNKSLGSAQAGVEVDLELENLEGDMKKLQEKEKILLNTWFKTKKNKAAVKNISMQIEKLGEDILCHNIHKKTEKNIELNEKEVLKKQSCDVKKYRRIPAQQTKMTNAILEGIEKNKENRVAQNIRWKPDVPSPKI